MNASSFFQLYLSNGERVWDINVSVLHVQAELNDLTSTADIPGSPVNIFLSFYGTSRYIPGYSSGLKIFPSVYLIFSYRQYS